MPPVHMTGTPFQLAVWEILRQIPYGKTITYGEIAQKIAQQRGVTHMSAQAVGGAVGHNKISIVIPCHRVVGTKLGVFDRIRRRDKQKDKITDLGEGKMEGSSFFVPQKGTAL